MLNTGHVYDGIVAEYPFLAGPHRSPKPAFYSKLMSAAGFTGYLCPLFGESTLNVDCPAVFLPATIAHEFSHQRGVAPPPEGPLNCPHDSDDFCSPFSLPPPVVMRHMNIPAG